MNKNKLILKGLLYGTNKIKEYSNPDILYSSIDNEIFNGNELTISYDKIKNNYYIYHSYDKYDLQLKKIYSGRWYDTKFNIECDLLCVENKTLTIKLENVEWVNFDTGITTIKNVEIIINFTPNGFDEFCDFIGIAKN